MFGRRLYPTSFDQFRREMNRLFDEVTHTVDPRTMFRGRTFPALNLWEDAECVYAEAEVPGLNMEDLDVNISGNELTIKGERKPIEGEGATYHRQERGTGTFLRTVTLPFEVNVDKVDALLKDGVLLITLPKAAAAKARKITVSTD